MLTSKPKLEIVYRVILIAMILFNAVAPTVVSAKTNQDVDKFGSLQTSPGSESQVNPILNQSSSQADADPKFPLFSHPQPRMAERVGQETDLLSALQSDNHPAIMFVENVGQFEKGAQFRTHGEQGAIYLTSQGLWVSLQEEKALPPETTGPSAVPTAMPGVAQATSTPGPDSATDMVTGVNLRMTFVGANSDAKMEGFESVDSTVSYFLGDDAKKWQADVPVWGGVRYVDFYPGYDLEVSSNSGALSWQLVSNQTTATSGEALQPGGITNVRLRIEGAEKLALAGNAVQVTTELGDMLLPLPVTESDQGRRSATQSEEDASNMGSAVLEGNEIVLPLVPSSSRNQQESPTTVPETPTSDYYGRHRSAAFTQDIATAPSTSLLLSSAWDLVYSTYLGPGDGSDIIVDESGAAYIVGSTESTSFPTTPGVYQTSLAGGRDVFVAKLSPDGSNLIYSTYIGGSSTDHGNGIALDENGNAYVTGRTLSLDYPTTSGAYDTTKSSSGNVAFVTKLNSTGTSLAYSTYLGNTDTQGFGIAVNSNGEAYLVGQTLEGTFPTTVGAYDRTSNGGYDGFVTRLNASGTNLVFSTFIGGNSGDCEHALDLVECDIALGPDESAYIAGPTGSTNFPTTSGAYDRTYSSLGDLFVLQLNPNGSALVYSTYLGSTGEEKCDPMCAIAVDSDGYAYMTGPTTSAYFPTTTGAYDRTYNGGKDAFLTKLEADGSGLVYSTYLGSSGNDEGRSIAVTSGSGPVLTGRASTSFPTSHDAIQSNCHTEDAFVTRFSINGDALNYSTCLGGTSYDVGNGITTTPQGTVYITGFANANGFPTTPGAYNTVAAGGAFVSKFVGFRTVVYTPSTYERCPEDCPLSAYSETFIPVGGPINTQTGGQYYQVEDISVPTSAGPLVFRRSYSSLATDFLTDPLGYGWTHNHDLRLILPTDPDGEEGYVLFKARSANRYQFIDNGNETYSAAPGVIGELTHNALGYTLTLSDRSTYTFDNTGVLLTWADSNGHTWEYTYIDGLLQQIDADGGTHFLALSYDPQGRIESVQDHTDRTVEFNYDTNGDLESVTDVLERNWEYEYDTSHHLTEVLDPPGNTIERTEYDTQGRAVRQWDGLNNLVVEITYHADGTRTVKDANDHLTTHTYDSRKTLIGNTDPLDGTLGKTYDQNFRPSTITDANNNITRLAWSEDGANLEYIKDALNHETFVSYNSLNQPASIIDPLDYETMYFYTDTDFPTLPTRVEYPLSFDGGVTYIGTDYEYYPPSSGASAGKVKFVTDALGSKTFYAYTTSGQTESVTTGYGTASVLTTNYEYDSSGRLVETTDPDGVVTRNEYDAAGQLLKTINNYVASRPQNDENKYNLVTEYRYDERNNPIAVIDTYGVITRTYYDTANRPVTVVQNLTGQSVDTLTPPARGSIIANENIRTDTIYDDAGNVIATIDPAGVFTRTYYDEANRPVTVVQNLTGQDISTATPPTYDPAFPDQNIRTDTVYDLNGNVIAMIDTLGTITRTYYDAMNRPVTIVQNLSDQAISVPTPPARGSESNIRTDTHYDANGNVIAIVDPRGVISRTYYDALNRPITVVQNLAGQTISNPNPPAAGTGATESNLRTDTYYDEAGNTIATVDPRGVITRTYYDASNRSYATVQNLTGQSIYINTPPARGDGLSDTNARTDISYDLSGRKDAMTDPRGRVTKYEYNELGQLIKTTRNFSNGGIPQNEDDQRNIVTAYEYDALGRQVKVTDTLGSVTLSAYDDLGRLLTTTQNHLPGQPQNYKDASGNQYNLITSFTYDVHGNQIAVTDTEGIITRGYHDMLGRHVTAVRNLFGHDISLLVPPEREDPPSSTANIRTDTVYLGTGAVDYTLDAMGEMTDYSYDSLGRLTAVSDPLSHTTTFEYDANGNRTFVTDAENITTHYEYDALNRLKAVIENYSTTQPADHETNVRTEYTYDAAGNRLSILDGNNHSTSFTYTAFGLLETEIDALSNASAHEYDAMGNRRSLLDANGNTTSFDYDELDRPVLIDYPTSDPNVSFDYDALSRRLSMTDGTGTTTWTYTNLDQPGLITDPFGTEVSYDYDAAGNRTELSYNEQTLNYVYNDLNQLSEVSGSGLPDAVQYGYDATGRVRSVSRPNGVNTTYNYFDNGWLQDLTHSVDSNPLASYQYQYDGVGNRVEAVEEFNVPEPPELSILEDGFETGDLSTWSGAETDDGDLSVTPEAAMEGNYGMQAVIDDANSLYVQDDLPNQESNYHARFYFDLNSVEMSNDDYFDLFRAFNGSGESAFQVRLRYSDSEGGYQIGVIALDDAQQAVETEWLSLSGDLLHGVEVEWVTPSEPEAGDGHLSVWLDGSPDRRELLDLDTDSKTIDSVRLGVLSPSSDEINGMVYFDNFVSNRGGYIGPDPDIQFHFADTFESGDLSAWSSAETDNGDLSVSSQALIEGGHELQAVIDDTNELYVEDESLNEERIYHARFYFDPNAVEIPDGESLDLLRGVGAAGTAFSIRFNVIDSDYALQAILVSDDGIERASDPILIPDDFHFIEMEWWAAGSDEFHDGGINLGVNDSLFASVHDVDNDMRQINSVQLGVLAPSSDGISGSVYFDDFISVLDFQFIGPNPNVSLPDYLSITTDDFESGDLSGWSSAETDGGDLSATSAAAIEGSYGLQAVINDQSDLYVTDAKPVEDRSYRARFYFDPNSVEIPADGSFDLFKGIGNSGTSFLLRLGALNDEYALKIILVRDDETTEESAWIPVGDQPHHVEVGWWTAWAEDAPDGRMFLWVDDQWKATILDQDNDTKRITAVQLGILAPSSTDINGTIYLDDFDSMRNGDHYIGLDPNVELPPSWQISADAFESGDLSGWNSAETDGGDLSVSSAAAIEGNYGMQAVVDDENELFVHDNLPLHESNYDARFYFDPNSLTIPQNEILSLLRAEDLAQGSILEVRLQKVEGEYQVQAVIYDDTQTPLESSWYAMTDEAHFVEVEWWAAEEGLNNGYLGLYLDDGFLGELTGIDNDSLRVDYAELGVLSPISSTIAGTLYFDDFLSGRGGHIGTGGLQMRLESEASASAEKQAEPQRTPSPTATPTPTRTPTATPTPRFLATPTATPAPERGLPPQKDVAEITSLPQAPMQLLLAESVSQTITYTYDPLYRLTSAEYSNEDYFSYTYDAVGNRLSQDTQLGGLPTTTTYLYDDANRLTDVNGVTYAWDNNGNLLDDGVNAYQYDAANRLKTLTGPSVNTSYAYNGLGDRLQETRNGNTTTFTMDLNTGLTQALSDGTNHYIYGLDRLAQVNSATEYFLGDALGSVRQMTDANAEITYTRAYDPYGVITATHGSSQTGYGYAGEYSDSYIKLIYLRSRWYDPASGRFPTKDSWQGDYNRPLSLNRWNYVEGNPINRIDPTGLTPLQSGYVEGFSIAAGVGDGDIDGNEIVYDYATMTRARFKYTGRVGGLFASIGVSFYLGKITGFRYEPKPLPVGLNSFPDLPYSQLIIDDYSEDFDGWYAGVSPIPVVGPRPNLTGGIGSFHSPDNKIKGTFSYVTPGIGLMPFEVVGFHTFYEVDKAALPGYRNTGVEYYYDPTTRRVNRSKLISDILTGNHSPILGKASVLANLSSWALGNRSGEIGRALIAADRFEKYYYQPEYGQCRPGQPDPQPLPPLNLEPPSPLDSVPWYQP